MRAARGPAAPAVSQSFLCVNAAAVAKSIVVVAVMRQIMMVNIILMMWIVVKFVANHIAMNADMLNAVICRREPFARDVPVSFLRRIRRRLTD